MVPLSIYLVNDLVQQVNSDIGLFDSCHTQETLEITELGHLDGEGIQLLHSLEYSSQDQLLYCFPVEDKSLENIPLLCEDAVEKSFLLLGDIEDTSEGWMTVAAQPSSSWWMKRPHDESLVELSNRPGQTTGRWEYGKWVLPKDLSLNPLKESLPRGQLPPLLCQESPPPVQPLHAFPPSARSPLILVLLVPRWEAPPLSSIEGKALGLRSLAISSRLRLSNLPSRR